MTYCPSCQTEVDTSVDVCPSCGWRFNTTGAKPGPTLVRAATRPKIQTEVEVAWLHDRSASGSAWAAGAPVTAKIIADEVGAKARSQKWWVRSHSDEELGEMPVLHTDGGTPDQAVEDIKNIPHSGGGDPPETHLSAIEEALDAIPWTMDPTRARGALIAYINADSKPAKSGNSAAEIGRRIKDKGILLYLICEPTPTLQELATAAEGLVFQISNTPSPDELRQIGSQLSASIVATVASGGTVPMTVPA